MEEQVPENEKLASVDLIEVKAKSGVYISKKILIIAIVQAVVVVIVASLSMFFGVYIPDSKNSENAGNPDILKTDSPTISPTIDNTTLSPSSSPTLPPVICATTELKVPVRDPPDLYISLIFAKCPSEAIFDAFERAAKFWSSVITRNKIQPSLFPFEFDIRLACSLAQVEVIFPADYIFDHLAIYVETYPIDGPSHVLAGTEVCLVEGGNLRFPVLGAMRFDEDDVPGLNATGMLYKVILHEMAHALGLGSNWRYVKQGGGRFEDAQNVTPPLLRTPIYFDWLRLRKENNHGQFVGEEAVEQYIQLSPTGEIFNSVPVEDGMYADGTYFFDPHFGSGRGSIDAHWKKTTFGPELMTFLMASDDPPLSVLTIASLSDLGYDVDMSKVEEYVLPSIPWPEPGWDIQTTSPKKKLRGEPMEIITVDLSNDVKTSSPPMTVEQFKRKQLEAKSSKSKRVLLEL